MLLGKVLDRAHHPLQRCRLVVIQEQDHRRHGAVRVAQTAGSPTEGIVQYILVAADVMPLGTALVHALNHQFGHVHQRQRGLHAGHRLHFGLEALHSGDVIIVATLLFAGARHDDKNVGTGGVILGEEGIVDVVARIRTQLRRTGIEVADLLILTVPDTDCEERCADADDRQGGTTLRGTADETPVAVRTVVLVSTVAHAAVRYTRERQHQGQQHQIGEHQHRDPRAGNNRQLPDHRNLDDAESEETHAVTQQRDEAGLGQAYEGQTGGIDARYLVVDEVAETIDDLHRVADAHGEHQERHEHRIGVQPHAHHLEQTHLPDHRDRGTQ